MPIFTLPQTFFSVETLFFISNENRDLFWMEELELLTSKNIEINKYKIHTKSL